MRSKRLVTWLMLTAIAAPPSAFTAQTPVDPPRHEALSAEDLAAARGGSVPATKLGERSQYGHLAVYRKLNGTRFCGVPNTNSAPILPNTVSRPQCSPSIPTHSFVDDSVDVAIGGMAAILDQSTNPHVRVFVNGVEVPAAQLGDEFKERCAFEGYAYAENATLDRYNCSLGGANWAQIPVTYFHGGLNTITVYYQMVEAAFADWGNDIDTRIIAMQ